MDTDRATSSEASRAPTGGGLRADAERNRKRILATARSLYASTGLNVSMAEVARRAGVGKATLARHFATPAQLVNAVFADRMQAYAQATEQALTNPDPWRAFVDYIWTICEMQASDRGFADVLIMNVPGSADFEDGRERSFRGFLQLITAAKASGHLRDDFASEDFVLLLMANAGVLAATSTHAPESWRRLVGQTLRGYAAPSAPSPALPAAPSSVDLHAAMARAGWQ